MPVNYLEGRPPQPQLVFMQVLNPDRIRIGRFWFFVEGGKLENPKKIPRSKDENRKQTQPTYVIGPESNPGHISSYWWDESALTTASSLTLWSNETNFWWFKLVVHLSRSAGSPLQLDCEFRTSFSPKHITVRINNLRLCSRSFGTKNQLNCFVYIVILHNYWKKYLCLFGLSFEFWSGVM